MPRGKKKSAVQRRANTGGVDPKYLNIWHRIRGKIPRRKTAEAIPDIKVLAEAQGALEQVASQWQETFKQWTDSGRKVPPCMIVVCNNTLVAEMVADHIGTKGDSMPELKNAAESDPVTVRIDSKLICEAEAAVEPGQRVAAAAEALRTKVSTIGKEGKTGEQVRCVVSVAMLSEGWDAANVTQIMGLRAFTSQLLCEQVVGRGLRRMSYDVDPKTGLMTPEYVDVYGIPFQVIPVQKGKVGTIPPQPNYETIKARGDRSKLAITFPYVNGYVFDVRHDLIVDKASWADLTLDPSDEPTWVEVKELVGYATVTKPEPDAPGNVVRQNREWFYKTHRVQRTVFEISSRITNTWGAVETRMIFPLIRDAVEEYVRTRVRPLGDARIEDIALLKHMRVIEDRVRNSLKPADPKAGILPVIEKRGSTDGFVFQTAKRVYPTKKSPLSGAVIDSDWEQQVAIELDDNPRVVSWVKTDRIGFSIPYTFQGIEHGYRPDFLVKVKRHDGGIVHLVLEVKGRERAPEADKRQAAKRWIEAMNYLHQQSTDPETDFGPWAYLYAQGEDRYIVRNMLAYLAEGKPWPQGVVGYGHGP